MMVALYLGHLLIMSNKNNIKEETFNEKPYNYEKMLYKLIAQGLIQDDKKYL